MIETAQYLTDLCHVAPEQPDGLNDRGNILFDLPHNAASKWEVLNLKKAKNVFGLK